MSSVIVEMADNSVTADCAADIVIEAMIFFWQRRVVDESDALLLPLVTQLVMDDWAMISLDTIDPSRPRIATSASNFCNNHGACRRIDVGTLRGWLIKLSEVGFWKLETKKKQMSAF